MASVSTLLSVGSFCLSIKERFDILKETHKLAGFLCQLMEHLQPIVDQLTGKNEQVFIGQLEVVDNKLQKLLNDLKGPGFIQSVKKLMNQPDTKEFKAIYKELKKLVSQPENTRQLEAIYQELTSCLLCIQVSQIPDWKKAMAELSQDHSKLKEMLQKRFEGLSIKQDQVIDIIKLQEQLLEAFPDILQSMKSLHDKMEDIIDITSYCCEMIEQLQSMSLAKDETPKNVTNIYTENATFIHGDQTNIQGDMFAGCTMQDGVNQGNKGAGAGGEPDETDAGGTSASSEQQVDGGGDDALKEIISPLMNDPSSYGTHFLDGIVKGIKLTDVQIEAFTQYQKWGDDSVVDFRKTLEGGTYSLGDVLKAWAVAVQDIYRRNPKYTTIDERKCIWNMMQFLHKNFTGVFETLVEEKIFPGGVLGVNPDIAKKRVADIKFDRILKVRQLLELKHPCGKDWRGLADKLDGVTSHVIDLWDQADDAKATENTLKTYSTSKNGTIQHLYEDLIDMDRCDVAELLEY